MARNDRRKRVILANPCADMVGGAEVSLALLLAGLDQTRYEATLLLPQPGELGELAAALGVEVDFLPMHTMMLERELVRSGKDALSAFGEVPALSRYLAERTPNIVHLNSYRIGVPFALAARRHGIPTIWHVRTIPNSSAKKRLVAHSVRFADKVIAISDAVRQAIDRYHPNKFTTIFNGVDLRAYEDLPAGALRSGLNLLPQAFIFGSVGQIVPWKGHDRLIEAFAQVAKQMPYSFLAIVGDTKRAPWVEATTTDYFEQLQALIARLDLEGRVLFTGYRADVPALLADMDCYVHAATAPEPFGRVLIEAMAASKAVIAPAWGGIPEIVVEGQTGWLFKPNDVAGMAACMIQATSDSAHLAALGRAGRKRAQAEFSMERYVSAVEHEYELLTGPCSEERPQ